MSVLICPVCGQALIKQDHYCKCPSNHSFDIAKEGYVNLLSAHKSGDKVGDNREMSRSRRDFLNKGYYSLLAEAVGDCIKKYTYDGDTVLDICCGEGYYTSMLSNRFNRDFYGFDISKNMVRLAAKRRCGAEFFVANIASIPIRTESVNFAFHLFAPFHNGEFNRVLKKDGVVVTAVPGKEHLFGLKEFLYEEPYFNDEKPPQTENFELIDTVRARSEIILTSNDDILSLFQMTPYYYHTPSESMAKIDGLNQLITAVDFVLYVYKKQ